MIVLVAGLRSLPEYVYEVMAALDGLRPVETFFKITSPLLRPVILIVLATSLHGCLRADGPGVHAYQRRTPAGHTETLSYYIYVMGLQLFRVGLAAAVSIIFLIFINIATQVFVRATCIASRRVGSLRNEAEGYEHERSYLARQGVGPYDSKPYLARQGVGPRERRCPLCQCGRPTARRRWGLTLRCSCTSPSVWHLLLFMVLASLKSDVEIFDPGVRFVFTPTFANYQEVLTVGYGRGAGGGQLHGRIDRAQGRCSRAR